MTLNIISNSAANTALRNLTINGDEVVKSVSKLSSGSRVVTAADDAAALAIGSRLNTEVRSLLQASVNASQAVALLQIADGGLSRAQEMLTRMKVLAVQAGSANLTNTERSLLDTEFQNLKEEISRITKDTKFNGVSLVGREAYVAGTGLTAANSLANEGLAAIAGGNQTTQVGIAEGDTNGVVDIALRGVDNRARTLGGDGPVIVTIYQGDVSISPDTGSSVDGANFLLLGAGAAPTGFRWDVVEDLPLNPGVSILDPGGPVGATQRVLTERTGQTQATTYNAVGYAGSALAYGTFGERFQTNRTQQQSTYQINTAAGPIPGFNNGSLAGADYWSCNEIVGAVGAIGPQIVTNSGGQAAQINQDLVFTAIFEFGDLDGDGFSDVIVKKAKIDGALFAAGGAAHTNDVGLKSGVTLTFGNDDADFSSAGGVSENTRRNASIAIAIDPGQGTNLNLARDAVGDFQGLFAAATQRFVQATFAEAAGGESGPAGFDFKVGSGIIRDEDNIAIVLSGVTLEQLGVENADILTKTAADAANEAVSSALDYLVGARTVVGASINRLEAAGDNIAVSMESQEAARSRLLDLNVAEEVARYTSRLILYQTGTSVLAQAQSLPREALRLYGATVFGRER